MKRTIALILLMILTINNSKAQQYFDMGTTSVLISQNKKNYSDNNRARDNQVVSQATVKSWKITKAKCKSIMDSLDKRLTQAYIVYADALTISEVAGVMADIISMQAQSLKQLTKYPYALPIFVDNEVKIVDDAVSLYKLITLIVISYGDINKLKVSSRKVIFTQVKFQLQYLRAKCYVLNETLNSIAFANLYKSTPTYKYIDMDKQKIKDILKNWKN